MLLSHLFIEGIGPFKDLHLDLRGPDGHASCGPHILAGVNGSGKSTVLKSIAWCLTTNGDGFPFAEWAHFLKAHPSSRAMIVFDTFRYVWSTTSDRSDGWEMRLKEWVGRNLTSVGLPPQDYPQTKSYELGSGASENSLSVALRGRLSHKLDHLLAKFRRAGFGGVDLDKAGALYNAAAYSSTRSIRYVENLDMALPREKARLNRFGFDSTVQNQAIQSWLLGLYSKRAIANERHESSSRYTASFDALERGLKRICGDDVSIVVDIEPNFQPGLRVGNKTLNFSQIPDGIKATIGWLADFMMRSDQQKWDPIADDSRPGLLLFDEIEGYLHPLWQRRVLPALREALPNTQSIVTSHSPFVISSCPQSIVHVLKLRPDGIAYVERPSPAPIGESVTSTLKEIFGVDSRFDVKTEQELAEWNELNKTRVARGLGPKERRRFQNLSRILAARSEQLRSIVDPVPNLPESTVEALTTKKNGAIRRRVAGSA